MNRWNWHIHLPSNFVIRGVSGVIASPLQSLIPSPCPPLHILYRFCVKSFPSELNPQSGPLLEPLSCWSALTLTPLFISGTQLSRSQVEESQRERQECKLVSQISTSTLIYSSLPCSTHFLSCLLCDAFEMKKKVCLHGNQSRYNIVQLLASKACLKCFRITGKGPLACCFGYVDGWSKTLPHLFFWWNFKHRTFIYSCSSCTHVLIIWHDWWICFCLSISFIFGFYTISFWGRFLVSRRSRFKCWGSRSPHVWSVDPGDPSKNLRHTCAGRSGSLTQSRWTVSSLAAGHAPPPNNAKLTALQSCMQVRSAGMFSGQALQRHRHIHSLLMTNQRKIYGMGVFPASLSCLKKVSCVCCYAGCSACVRCER